MSNEQIDDFINEVYHAVNFEYDLTLFTQGE